MNEILVLRTLLYFIDPRKLSNFGLVLVKVKIQHHCCLDYWDGAAQRGAAIVC